MDSMKINLVELWNSDDEKELEKVKDEVWNKFFAYGDAVNLILDIDNLKFSVPSLCVGVFRLVKAAYIGGFYVSIECYDEDYNEIARINLPTGQSHFLNITEENDNIVISTANE